MGIVKKPSHKSFALTSSSEINIQIHTTVPPPKHNIHLVYDKAFVATNAAAASAKVVTSAEWTVRLSPVAQTVSWTMQ
jgi:hypothetical protein